MCIFSRKMEAIVIISFKYFCNTLEKMSTNIIMLPKWDVVSMNKQTNTFLLLWQPKNAHSS